MLFITEQISWAPFLYLAVRITLLFFWVVTLCRLIGRYQHFRETYCLHVRGWSGNAKSKSHYEWRSVGQSVLVSSPFWDSWPDFSLTLDIYSPCHHWAPSLTRDQVCYLLEVLVFVTCLQFFIYKMYIEEYIVTYVQYVEYIQGLCHSRLCTADHASPYLAYAITAAAVAQSV
jgi:hypothetical protein